MSRRKNTRRSNDTAAPQRWAVPGSALASSNPHPAASAASPRYDEVGDVVLEMPTPPSGSPVRTWFRRTPDRLLCVMACTDCGARSDILLCEGPLDNVSERDALLLHAGCEHFLTFGNAHAACAATVGHALPAWPESTWGVPSALAQHVAYWVDDVLDEAMRADRDRDSSSLSGSRHMLVRLRDGTLARASRPLALAGPGAEAEIRGWWHEHLHDTVATAGGELVAVMTVVHDVPAPPVPGGERVIAWAEVITPEAAFATPLAAPTDPTIHESALEFPWQPLADPQPSIDGLFAMTLA